MADVRGKVVIVTGASSGIGEASAKAFGRAGARVVLAARRVERLQGVADEIRGMGGEALVVPADLSRQEDILKLVDSTLDGFGRIDVLFNNAGFGRLNWLERLEPEKDVQAQVAVNLLGVVLTTRLVLPHMIAQRSGHIINMGSMAGWVATPTYTVYAACKFAVRGFSEALRREVAPWGIRVSSLYPAGVTTEFASHAGIQRKTKATTPKWLRLTPEQVADRVVGLVRRPKNDLIFPWPLRFAAWLNQIAPALVDWTTIRNFTVPERIDELKAAGLR
jgi:short-subunit dehydrogenase